MLCALSVAGAMVLAACGSGGSDTGTGNVRMLNLTRAHPSLDLLVSSSKQLSAVASYSASTYTGVTSGNNTLQVADAGTQTARTWTLLPTNEENAARWSPGASTLPTPAALTGA